MRGCLCEKEVTDKVTGVLSVHFQLRGLLHGKCNADRWFETP